MSNLHPLVHRELAASRTARRARDTIGAWRSLERAHVLSQPSAWLHTRVHLAMLALAFRARDSREIVGQVVRLTVAALGSWLGRYPIGNDGRARSPINQPMPIADELRAELAAARGPGFDEPQITA